MIERYRVSVPWLLERLGVRKWLAERVFHMPERYVAGWCTTLSRALGMELTPEHWRHIEARLVCLLYDGVLVNVATGEDDG